MSIMLGHTSTSSAMALPLATCQHLRDAIWDLETNAPDVSGRQTDASVDLTALAERLGMHLPEPNVTSLSTRQIAQAVRLLEARGVSPDDGDVEGRSDQLSARRWHLRQALLEKLVSAASTGLRGTHRHERSWRDLSPSVVGQIHRVYRSDGWSESREHVVIGEACPICDRGRLALFSHPDDDSTGVLCNGGCGFGREISRLPVGRVDDERTLWQQPSAALRQRAVLPDEAIAWAMET